MASRPLPRAGRQGLPDLQPCCSRALQRAPEGGCLMDGPSHYREAEMLLAQAFGPDHLTEEEPRLVWAANVHATLALAAATALRTTDGSLPDGAYREWYDLAARPEVTG